MGMRDALVVMGGLNELTVPAVLVAAAEREGRAGWLRTLPVTIRQLQVSWSVVVGEPFQPGSQTAWVAPARRGAADLVIKVLWRHPEAEHEADALGAWGGTGAVRVHAACEVSATTTALLSERCRSGTALSVLAEPEQDVVIAGLLRRLWIQAPVGHRRRSPARARAARRPADRGAGRSAGSPAAWCAAG